MVSSKGVTPTRGDGQWGRDYTQLQPALPRPGPAAPHLVPLYLGEDLEQLGDVRGGCPCLPVELQDSNQLVSGDFLLKGDAAVHCGEKGRAGKSPGLGGPRLACSGLAIFPAPPGGPKVPSLSKTLHQHTRPTSCHLELASLPSLRCGCQEAGQARSLWGTEGLRRESLSKKKMAREPDTIEIWKQGITGMRQF